MANDGANLRPVKAQLTEPPYADPHVRWCGRGGEVTLPPMPIVPSMFDSLGVKVLYPT